MAPKLEKCPTNSKIGKFPRNFSKTSDHYGSKLGHNLKPDFLKIFKTNTYPKDTASRPNSGGVP
jgi:hypothetical protein